MPLVPEVLCAKISDELIPLCTKYDLSDGMERKGRFGPPCSTESSFSFLINLSDCNWPLCLFKSVRRKERFCPVASVPLRMVVRVSRYPAWTWGVSLKLSNGSTRIFALAAASNSAAVKVVSYIDFINYYLAPMHTPKSILANLIQTLI